MRNQDYKFKKIKGITLISLVITIVVLIILSSVAIYLSLGDNGIFTRAKEAKEVTNKQEATDIINLKITTAQINKYAEKQEMPTLQELADVLYEDNEIEYIALETKVGAKEKIIVGSKTSIFTKLNKYPYEFEINSSLQLASIDGIKFAGNAIKTGIFKVGTYEGTSVGASGDLHNEMENANTIQIDISKKYNNYKLLTIDNFLVIDNFNITYTKTLDTYISLQSKTTKLKDYNQETGVLTITICYTSIDCSRNSDDATSPGKTTIYLVENTDIENL